MSFQSSHESNVLERLQEAQEELNQRLHQAEIDYPVGEDDESDVSDVYFDQYMREATNSIMVMTGFSAREFEKLYAVVQSDLEASMLRGRGRRSSISPKDSFFIVLSVLKHAHGWEKHALDFRLKVSALATMVHKTLSTIDLPLTKAFYSAQTMSNLLERGLLFQNFSFALYATYVRFQPCPRPTGNLEQRKYFSGKHHRHGFKTEVSVDPTGQAIAFSDHFPGSVHDFAIFKSRLDVHRALMAKSEEELQSFEDEFELFQEFPNQWAQLVDKGYDGASNLLRGCLPTKKPPKGILPRDQRIRNNKLGSDRVLIENYFGRETSLWGIMREVFPWNESCYDQVSRICIHLTNFHIRNHPLRVEDAGKFRQVRSVIEKEGIGKLERRAASQRRYRERKRRRLNDELDENQELNLNEGSDSDLSP